MRSAAWAAVAVAPAEEARATLVEAADYLPCGNGCSAHAELASAFCFRMGDQVLVGDGRSYLHEKKFSSMEDFEPAKVAEQVEPLRKLLELRRKLSNLRSTLYGNEKLDQLLQEVVHSTETFGKLQAELGMSKPEDQGEPAKKRKG